MLEINCPHCQEYRSQSEFSAGEEAFIARPEKPGELSDEQWADYVFFRRNAKGVHWELWVHTHGCRKYLMVKRNTITHQIEETRKLDEAVQDQLM